jgi:hypothetical protein
MGKLHHRGTMKPLISLPLATDARRRAPQRTAPALPRRPRVTRASSAECARRSSTAAAATSCSRLRSTRRSWNAAGRAVGVRLRQRSRAGQHLYERPKPAGPCDGHSASPEHALRLCQQLGYVNSSGCETLRFQADSVNGIEISSQTVASGFPDAAPGVRQWRVESRSTHSARCMVSIKGRLVPTGAPMYLPFSVVVTAVPFPYPTQP